MNNLPKPYIIKKVITENAQIKSFELVGDDLGDVLPGQFIMASIPGVDERPFCVADKEPFTLTIANVGDFSQKIHNLKVTDKIYIRGPFGTHFPVNAELNRPVLIGGGYGAAPLSWLACEMLKENIMPQVVLGGRSEGNIILIDKFKKLGITPIITTNDGSMGVKGLVTDALLPLLEKAKVNAVYAIGPNPMLDAILSLAEKFKLAHYLSYEAKMCCAMGLCGKCEHKNKILCTEGPVLN